MHENSTGPFADNKEFALLQIPLKSLIKKKNP